MKARDYIWLGVLGLLPVFLVAIFQSTPGYMDAEYYFQGGLQLARGAGFNEYILWNYLDDPLGLPHSSHAYWMPLTSILAWLGMAFTGLPRFETARLGFILLAALLPPVVAALSYQLNHRGDFAIFSACLSLFPAFYLPYLPTTDVFSPFMLFGATFLLMVAAPMAGLIRPFLLGLLAGLMHLSRADGLIWLVVALYALVVYAPGGTTRTCLSRTVTSLLVCALGYGIVMGPWMARNITIFGAPLSPGGGRALWITNYDELFIYPASLLTPSRWWESGLEAIMRARFWAIGQNLQTVLGVQGEIFLAPLILAGLWRLRNERSVRLGVLAWSLTFLVMTLIFPYQGARGGFFHSASALQPLFWAAVPPGLETFLGWAGRIRRWNIPQARAFFRFGLVLLALLLSFLVVSRRVVGGDLYSPAWDNGHRRYVSMEEFLSGLGAAPGEAVLVNDSPGYFLASERPALSIPYGDLQTLLSLAERYQARYLLLEFNQLLGPEDLYAEPGDRPGLHYLGTVEDTRVYQFVQE